MLLLQNSLHYVCEMTWLLTQNKARNIFHAILGSDKGYVD